MLPPPVHDPLQHVEHWQPEEAVHSVPLALQGAGGGDGGDGGGGGGLGGDGGGGGGLGGLGAAL